MLNYVNDFQCTCPNDKSSVIVSLNQIAPDFENSTSETFSQKRETVTSIVIDTDIALALAESIITLLSDDKPVQSTEK